MVESPLRTLPASSCRPVHHSNAPKAHLCSCSCKLTAGSAAPQPSWLVRAVGGSESPRQSKSRLLWPGGHHRHRGQPGSAAGRRRARSAAGRGALTDPALGNVLTAAHPPALSLWHLTVASSSPLQAPQASKSLHLQSEPPLPLSEAKSSEEMEIPQFSKIAVPFQTRCGSGHGAGRAAALRGRAAPQLGGRTSAAHQGNSFQQPEEKLLICLFEPSGAARALKRNISALTATFPMLSSSSSSSSTPKHLETLQAKFSDNVSGKEAGKSL